MQQLRTQLWKQLRKQLTLMTVGCNKCCSKAFYLQVTKLHTVPEPASARVPFGG